MIMSSGRSALQETASREGTTECFDLKEGSGDDGYYDFKTKGMSRPGGASTPNEQKGARNLLRIHGELASMLLIHSFDYSQAMCPLLPFGVKHLPQAPSR